MRKTLNIIIALLLIGLACVSLYVWVLGAVFGLILLGSPHASLSPWEYVFMLGVVFYPVPLVVSIVLMVILRVKAKIKNMGSIMVLSATIPLFYILVLALLFFALDAKWLS